VSLIESQSQIHDEVASMCKDWEMTERPLHIEVDIKDIYIQGLENQKLLTQIITELAIGKYSERLTALEQSNWKQRGFAAAIGAGISLFVDKLHFH
jgi:hypothetical protein